MTLSEAQGHRRRPGRGYRNLPELQGFSAEGSHDEADGLAPNGFRRIAPTTVLRFLYQLFLARFAVDGDRVRFGGGVYLFK
jgi:hypothetical protein